MVPDADALQPLPCACASLRRAARAVTQLYDDELRRAGLNTAQFTLLKVLASGGDVTQGSLGRMLALDSTTLSRTLRPLEARRWISVEPGEDRRERRIELTAQGRRRLDSATPAWERAQHRLRSRLGPGAWTTLLAELARVAGLARCG
jgi:DNA-binding MarR family transcriptional regulator